MEKIKIKQVAPSEIEPESFRIIDAHVEDMRQRGEAVPAFSPEEYQIARRMVHATGDYEIFSLVRFSDRAVEAGLSAIRAGRNILVDVNMAAMGVSRRMLGRFGGQVVCRIGDEETSVLARQNGLTRSEAAVMRAAGDDVGIVAVGNAPTALLKVMELVDAGRLCPELVIGVPVGFVNAAESKELLMRKDYPFISLKGTKGGTPLAVAAINALVRLA